MDIQEVFNNIGFDPKMAIFSTINFLIVFLVLNKFLFKKVGKILSDRQSEISESLKNAEFFKNAKKEAELESDKIIAEANSKANEIIKTSQLRAEELFKKSENEASEKAENIVNDARELIKNEKNKMIRDLTEEISKLAIEGAEKIILQKINDKSDLDLIKSYINKLDI